MWAAIDAENAGAPTRPVAPVAVRMVGAQPLQDPGSVQEIMDQGVDRYEGPRRLRATAAVVFRRSAASYDMAIAKTLSATP